MAIRLARFRSELDVPMHFFCLLRPLFEKASSISPTWIPTNHPPFGYADDEMLPIDLWDVKHPTRSQPREHQSLGL